MSYYDYNGGRSSRPSHTGGDSHNGSFEQVPGSHSSPHPPQQHPTYVPTANEMRSPHPHVYSPQASAGYPQYQSLTHTQTHTSPYISGSSRGSMPVAAPASPHHHQSIPMGHSSVDRTPHPHIQVPRTSAQLPFARNAPEMASPVDYPSDSSEPTIKKNRKRTAARQLEVLNATYNRTAFPSTEERAALAKQLDLSVRSVQIWFQNKRQSMRQGGRTINPATTPVSSAGPASPPVPTPTPPVAYRSTSPSVTASGMVQQPGSINDPSESSLGIFSTL